jgi:surfeit locus 1 family protein
MRPRTILFVACAVLAASFFTRLGFWQLSRLHERRARNTIVVAGQRDAPVPVSALPTDTTAAHYRPASVRGRFDYDHELVLAGRTHQGSPGVELITPMAPADGGMAILVNRGWVYSPDAGSVDRTRWHEGDSTTTVRGYVALYAPDAGATQSVLDPHIVRRVSRSEVATRVPYPLAPYYLVETGDTAGVQHPARRDIPALDDGPHKGYAIQWFSFAITALVGALFVVLREREGMRRETPGRR